MSYDDNPPWVPTEEEWGRLWFGKWRRLAGRMTDGIGGRDVLVAVADLPRPLPNHAPGYVWPKAGKWCDEGC